MKGTLAAVLREGGPVLWTNLALAVLLYGRCCGLLLWISRARRELHGVSGAGAEMIPALHRWQDEFQAFYQRQRLVIAAMIAAAPLLGLLGTVGGMIATFESLSNRRSAMAIEGLARGISEALLNTEAGLAVAIPAVLLLYYGHRQMQKGLGQLVQLEDSARGRTLS